MCEDSNKKPRNSSLWPFLGGGVTALRLLGEKGRWGQSVPWGDGHAYPWFPSGCTTPDLPRVFPAGPKRPSHGGRPCCLSYGIWNCSRNT